MTRSKTRAADSSAADPRRRVMANRHTANGNTIAAATAARDSATGDTAAGDAADWLDAQRRGRIRRQLLTWFAGQSRSLPWRDEPTPYHVWVSEIMLQQTQVATVVDYYRRFLAAFPTIADLAAAPEQRLMRLWEGLGYYRRARSMHAAAQRIVREHGGVFPETFDEVLSLPGIGRYTAGAILSISRGQRHPVLEGNTQRVYSRWIGFRGDITTAKGKEVLWQVATEMLPRTGAGQFNQAAMELGSLICKPKDPGCDRCPVRRECRAHLQGWQQEIPGKVTRIEYESRLEFGFVVPDPAGQVLVNRIPDGQRWAGLWDFPRWIAGDVTHAAGAAAALSRQWGLSIRPVESWLTLKHAVTRYRITLEVHRAAPLRDVPKLDDDGRLRFVSISELTDLPLSTTGRKIARKLAGK